jgi:hypothetical protein
LLLQPAVAQGVDPRGHLRVVVAFPAEVFLHPRPVLLLDMRVVVLGPGPPLSQKPRSSAMAQVGVRTTGIGFAGRQPFGQQSPQMEPAGLKGGEPDWGEDWQQPLGVIGPGSAREQARRAWCSRAGAQGADGGLAVVAQQADRMVEPWTFVKPAGPGISMPQFGRYFAFGFVRSLRCSKRVAPACVAVARFGERVHPTRVTILLTQIAGGFEVSFALAG